MTSRPGPRLALLALAGAAAFVAALAALPAGRAFLAEDVVAPLRAQAEGGGGGYTSRALAFWALEGALLATAAYAGVIVPLRLAWDARLALALAPFLAWGPLFHALVAHGEISPRAVAVAGAEPLVYVTTAALAASALALGALLARASRSERARTWTPLAVGVALLALLAPATIRASDGGHPATAAGVLVAAAAVGFAAFGLASALRARAPLAAALATWAGAAVVAAHALDGLSTWLVLRDPFGYGYPAFAEKNPVSNALVSVGNGVLFPVLKVALAAAIVTYAWESTRRDEDRAYRGPILLALFALGWGPGFANALLTAFSS